MKSGGDGLGEVPRCFVSAGGDDDDSGKKTSKSTMQEDAFLQSAYNVSEDSTLRDELSDLKNSVESDPLSRHAAKIKAFGICATSAPDLMNLLTSANIVVPKGKSDLLPEFLMRKRLGRIRICTVLTHFESEEPQQPWQPGLHQRISSCWADGILTAIRSTVDYVGRQR